MATRRYIGNALPVAQVDTITVANTWATNDTCTVTINDKDLTLTVGTDTTTANVATAIKEMINGDAQTGTGDHDFSETGDNVAEFREVTATVDSAVVSVTGPSGVPFTMTVTETTGGSGTATETTATAATGPWHADNADNWTGGSVPVDADDLIFDEGSGSVLYGLDQAGVTPTSIKITSGFTNSIGLPKIRVNANGDEYVEYRDRYLQYGAAADATDIQIEIGKGAGGSSGRIFLDLEDSEFSAVIYKTAAPTLPSDYAVQLLGSDSGNTMEVYGSSSVGVAPDEDETAHLDSLIVYLDPFGGSNEVYLGSGVDVANATIVNSRGQLTLNSATGSGTISNNGDLTVFSGAHASITNRRDGTVNYLSDGTLTAGDNYGTWDCRGDGSARTYTDFKMHTGAVFYDPTRTVTHTNPIELEGCGFDDVEIDKGQDITLAVGTP